MNQPLVSFIMPVYQAARYLPEALDSIAQQDYPKWELVAVDDNGFAGKDWEILSHFHTQFPHQVKLLFNPYNQGTSYARKRAFNHSTGEFIAFLDADDVCTPQRLGQSLEALQAHPDAVLVHGAVNPMGDAPTFSPFSTLQTYELPNTAEYLTRNRICCSTVMIRRSAIRRRDFPVKMHYQYEDWVLWNRLASRGKFVFLPQVLCGYRMHPQNFTSRHQSKRYRYQWAAKLEMLWHSWDASQPFNLQFRIFKSLVALLFQPAYLSLKK